MFVLPLTEVGVGAGWHHLDHPGGWQGAVLDHPIGTIWGYTADVLGQLDAIAP
ncbi:MAG TPA: hypothetical protein VHZ06_03330 [Marmoricola sp.]|nr:hypothetical protein [Marmoricola sp.]